MVVGWVVHGFTWVCARNGSAARLNFGDGRDEVTRTGGGVGGKKKERNPAGVSDFTC